MKKEKFEGKKKKKIAKINKNDHMPFSSQVWLRP